jgi:Rad3-related DNA helicase
MATIGHAAVTHSGAPVRGLEPPACPSFDSPFDYAAQAEVLIVTDVPKGDLAALAGAYARLIEAAKGGALGLFTAIRRLRAVHGRIADRLARGGLPLYAQHVDPIDTGTLVDIFRDDPRASAARHRCLARRGRCARPFAAAGGDGAGALAQALDPAPRPAAGRRRQCLR